MKTYYLKIRDKFISDIKNRVNLKWKNHQENFTNERKQDT